ncbi:MAG: PTS sugar transporter subunit IIC [Lactovum sp.]
MKKLDLEKISEKMLPYISKFSQHKWIKSISTGFMFVIPFTLVAAIFSILATPPITQAIIDEGGWYASLMRGWFNFSETYKEILTLPSNMTIGLISVISVIGISYTLAKELKMKNQLTATITTLIMFLIVAAPTTTAVLATALTGDVNAESLASSMSNVIDVGNLGAAGLFVAIIISIASVELMNFCINKNITIRFSESVPENVAAPFRAFIPVLINTLVFYGLSLLVSMLTGTTLPNLIMGLLMPAISNVNTLWGVLFICFLDKFLWFFGIHGGAVTMMLYLPLSMQLTAENAASVAAGGTATWYPITATTVASAYIGLNLAMLIVGKSQKLKAIGKLALGPNLFNINEPIIFGTPILYNMWLLVPGILIPLFQVTVYCIIGSMGLLAGDFNILMVNLPMGFNAFFGSMNIVNALVVIGIPLLGTFLWIPFVKLYDKQLVKEEQSQLEEA